MSLSPHVWFLKHKKRENPQVLSQCKHEKKEEYEIFPWDFQKPHIIWEKCQVNKRPEMGSPIRSCAATLRADKKWRLWILRYVLNTHRLRNRKTKARQQISREFWKFSTRTVNGRRRGPALIPWNRDAPSQCSISHRLMMFHISFYGLRQGHFPNSPANTPFGRLPNAPPSNQKISAGFSLQHSAQKDKSWIRDKERR